MGIVLEEADETVFWLELLSETGVLRVEKTQELLKEANELRAIFGASLRTSSVVSAPESIECSNQVNCAGVVSMPEWLNV